MLRFSCLSILLLSLLANKTIGQRLFLSPSEYIINNSGQVKVIGQADNLTACFVEGYDGRQVIWYDSIMRRAGVSNLDFMGNGSELYRFYATAGSIYIFYQKKKRKQVELWAAKLVPVHKDTIRPILLDSLELATVWDEARFEVYESLQPNRFIYSYTNYQNKENKLTVQATLLDASFNLLNHVNETIENIVFHTVLNVRTDENNGLHILFGEPDIVNGGIQNILIGSQKRQTSHMKFAKLQLEDYRLRGGQLIYDKQSKQFYFGCLMHRVGSDLLQALGAFSYSPNDEKWIERKITSINSLPNNEQQRMTNLRLRKFSMRSDGGCAFVTEKVFEETYQRNRSIGFVTPGLGMMTSTYSVYHNDEIIVMNIDANGELAWHEVILKSQETADANERFQSFGMLEYPLGQVYLYTEKRNSADRFITAYLSNKGSLRLKQFQTASYKDLEEGGLLLRSAQQIASNEIVFPVINRGTISFAKIIF